MSKKCVLAIAVSAAVSAQVNLAMAQDSAGAGSSLALEEIVVTATKTGAANLQDVPIAITAYTGESLEKSGIRGLEGLDNLTPGLTGNLSNMYAAPKIRGVGSNNLFIGGDPSVTLQVDGVYIPRQSGAALDFLDIERIEVLRGPQGTVYGRNASAGTINVVTKAPSQEFEGEAKIQAGNEGQFVYEGRISGPLFSDELSYSLVGRHLEHDALLNNVVEGSPDRKDRDYDTLRGKILWTPTEDVDITFAADWIEQFFGGTGSFVSGQAPEGVIDREDIDGVVTNDFYDVALDGSSKMRNEVWGASITAIADLDFATLTSITSYRDAVFDVAIDLDATALPLFTTHAFPEDSQTYAQEVSLNGNTENFDWVGGIYLYLDDAYTYFNLEINNLLPDGSPVFNSLATSGTDIITYSASAFFQGTYRVTDNLSITAGARYIVESKDVETLTGFEVLPLWTTGQNRLRDVNGNYTGDDPLLQAAGTTRLPDQTTWTEWTPKLALEYRLTDDILTYVSATKGFKSGGYNLIVTDQNVGYDPETVWAYEAGYKSTFQDGRGVFNVALFYYDYEGFQQLIFSGAGTEFTLNSDALVSQGFEIEASYSLTENLLIGGNVAYLDAYYDDPDLVTTNPLTGLPENIDGNDLTDAPPWTGAIYAQYGVDFDFGTVNFYIDAAYKDERFYHETNNIAQIGDAFTQVNASITYTDPTQSWELSLIGRNITDEEFVTGYNFFVYPGANPGNQRLLSASLKYMF